MNRHVWLLAGGLVIGAIAGCADDFAPNRTRHYSRAVEDPVERGSERAEVMGDSDGSLARTGNGIPIAEVDFGNRPGQETTARITAIDNAKASVTAITQPASTLPASTQPGVNIDKAPTIIMVDPITGKRP